MTSKETIQRLLPHFRDAVLDIRDFKSLRVVGEGAFATVHKCQRLSTQEVVAVKVLKPQMLRHEQDVYDFFLEAQVLRKLKHDAVVRFIGICYGRLQQKYGYDSLCVVTEFMEGGTLKSWIQAQTERPERVIYTKRTALQWMIQIAEGLDYLHTRRVAIIHRDLKPENILLCPAEPNSTRYVVKIADFGLSAMISTSSQQMSIETDSSMELDRIDSEALPELLKHGQQRVDRSLDTLKKAMKGVSLVFHMDGKWPQTTSGSQLGTLPRCMTGKTGSLLYMAPEVLRSQKYNERVDVFSFGTILYETLQGVRVAERFGKNYTVTEVQKFADTVRDGYRLPIPDDWPEEIRSLIEMCWKGLYLTVFTALMLNMCSVDEPEQRPSMRQVATRLRQMYKSGVFGKQTKRAGKKGSCFSCFRPKIPHHSQSPAARSPLS